MYGGSGIPFSFPVFLYSSEHYYDHHELCKETHSPVSGVQLDLQGPIFLHEPPHRVEFSNNFGGKADCQAHGVPLPVLEWMLTDGTPVTPITDIRIIHANGSLIFPPFPAEKFRHDVHTAIYRCVAKNQVGTILSRDVIVKAVVNQKYEVQVYDEYVISGNTAVLRCQVPNYLTDYVLITSWIQDDIVHIYPTTDTGGKYAVLKTGELYVFNAGPSDGYKSYSCRTVNKLTGKAQSSLYPARIVITEVKENVQPRGAGDKHSTKHVKVGEDVVLPCVAQGYPVPTYRWLKEDKDQLLPLTYTERISEIGQGLLHISKVKAEDGGKYTCWVNNSAGENTIHVNLVVTAPLSAHIQPQNQIVDVSKEATFACITGGFPIGQVSWFHNGRPVFKDGRRSFRTSPERLVVKPVQKEDHGMYQCFVNNEWDIAQSTAELQLGDASPELLSWFPERTLQPGPPLSLKCSATGNPPPHFFWTLDGFPVPDNSRFMMGQYITINDDVITHLNISSIKEEDGGEYMCTAKNSISQVSHSARINVYGRPFIREMPKINAIAGQQLVIKCPVAGYPIDSITWEQGGIPLPINRRQKAFTNGTLMIENVQKQSDAGTYTCQAKNKQKLSDRRDVEVNILVPPKILPIQAIVLREGMRAAITCQTIEGDLPFKFRWEKDWEAITDPKPQIRRVDEYASLLVIDNISTEHTGNYTCSAENVAGVESFTVPLTVNVPPRWRIEPNDVNVAAGQDMVLDCQAIGYPVPSIVWKKSIGEYLGEYKDFLYEPNVNVFPNGSLKFGKISKENEGHYLCEAKNEVGSGVSKLIFLKVNVPAHFPQKFKQMQVVQGEEAHLQCPALGDTPIEIQWKTNGQRIYEDKDPRYVIRDQPLDEGMVSELGISHTYRHDTGVFTCYASNAFGQNEMKIQLIVQEIPEIPKNIRINEQQSRSIQVAWTQPYAGNSPITSYIVQYKLVADDWEKHPDKVIVLGTTTTATIQGLQPSNSYHVRIIAENRLGKSEPSEVIQVTTQEEAPTGAPLEVFAEPKSSTEVKVTWKPPSKDLWNGKLLGYYVGYQEHPAGYTPSNSSAINYNFKTVDVGVQYGGEMLIQRLKKFSTYSVVVQAFNSKGAGPSSSPAVVRTKEDVPSSPPENVRCNTMSSQSVEVIWEPPNSDGQHGILLGYKVSYQPGDEWYIEEQQETKVTTLTRTIISGLLKYANYSVTVLAFTSAGDGTKSAAIFCRTDEDVPSPPKDIKAAISAPNKILITWLPPRHKNGQLISYTIYMSLIENGKEEGTHKRILGPDSGFHETVRHQEKATYQFWVTASTRVGEGESSRVVTIPPSSKVPARIMSFSRNIITPWKQNLNLTCRKVGIPSPQSVWKFQDKTIDRNGRRQVHKDGSLILKDVQKSDQGNYTCSVENVHGKDEIIYNVVVEVPPDRPKLSVISATSDSLQLEWEVADTAGNNILGYVINYKRDHGDWEELQLGAKINSYSLQNLWCATRYQLYITAFNKIGTGLPCDIVNGYTKGSVPVKPQPSKILTVNSTSASVWIDSWENGGCPIMYFIIEYQSAGQSSWSLASNSVQPSDRVYVLADLKPATKYNVKVTAHNNAGSTVGVYNFTTLTPAGAAVMPSEESEVSLSEDVPFYYNLKIIVIVFVTSTIFATLVATAAFIRRKRMIHRHLATLGESPSVAQIQNEQNRDQQYLAIQVRKKSADSNKIKADGDDYMSDICPYAAFQISKPPYAESTYSGNIYSGAYSSVKGSFVFHDLSAADTYKLKQYKDSEYTKVRRRGGKLRDPHSESQESDNLGSTDSEVKKILSMHMPISEYDALGSDSEGESRLCAGPPSPDLPPFRHRSRTGLKSADDDSSSSSENSRNEIKFQVRKTKSKGQSMKRHVRSSSGYSSHTEETTFSSHPSVKLSDLHPHSPLDPIDCEKLRGKRRSSSKGSITSKFNRETSFQIDV